MERGSSPARFISGSSPAKSSLVSLRIRHSSASGTPSSSVISFSGGQTAKSWTNSSSRSEPSPIISSRISVMMRLRLSSRRLMLDGLNQGWTRARYFGWSGGSICTSERIKPPCSMVASTSRSFGESLSRSKICIRTSWRTSGLCASFTRMGRGSLAKISGCFSISTMSACLVTAQKGRYSAGST